MLQTNQEQFSVILGVKGLLNCITLVSELKVDRKIPKSSRLQVSEKVPTKILTLSDTSRLPFLRKKN